MVVPLHPQPKGRDLYFCIVMLFQMRFLVAQTVKHLHAMQETWVRSLPRLLSGKDYAYQCSLGPEDSLEEEIIWYPFVNDLFH